MIACTAGLVDVVVLETAVGLKQSWSATRPLQVVKSVLSWINIDTLTIMIAG